MSFFHGWRRKIGVVTLLMACVLMAGWVRSLFFADSVTIRGRMSLDYNRVSSAGSNIVWLQASGFGGRPRQKSEPILIWRHNALPANNVRLVAPKFKWKFAGFAFQERPMSQEAVFKTLFVPYWSIVIPLTLLAAWLLLSKPRVSKPTP